MSQDAELSAIKTIVERLEKHVMGNGQPGIEQRISRTLGARIEQVARHAQRNAQDGDGNLLRMLEDEKTSREKQHAENKAESAALARKLDKQTVIISMFMGALMALKYLEDSGMATKLFR